MLTEHSSFDNRVKSLFGNDVKNDKKIILSFPKNSNESQKDLKAMDSIDIGAGFAYKIKLTEGVSCPFRAKVSVLYNSTLAREDLKKLLGQAVSITIENNSTSDTYKKVTSRALTGFVFSYTFDGMVATSSVDADNEALLNESDASSDQRIDYYSYSFDIASNVQLLDLNKRTKTYVGNATSSTKVLSVIEIIQALFQNYPSISIDISKLNSETYKYLSTTEYTYKQTRESDLSFLHRLCLLYGINYSSYYDATSFKEKVVFGKQLDFSFAQNTNEEQTDLVLDYEKGTALSVDCQLDYQKHLNLKKSYLLQRVQFDERCNILDNSNVPNGISLTDYEKFSIISNLHKTSRVINSSTSDESVNFIKDSCQGLIYNSSNQLIASANDLVFVPGLILNINDYFEKDKVAEFLITRSIMQFKLAIGAKCINKDIDNTESAIDQKLVGISNDTTCDLGSFCLYTMLDSIDGVCADEDPFDAISNVYKLQAKLTTKRALGKFGRGLAIDSNQDDATDDEPTDQDADTSSDSEQSGDIEPSSDIDDYINSNNMCLVCLVCDSQGDVKTNYGKLVLVENDDSICSRCSRLYILVDGQKQEAQYVSPTVTSLTVASSLPRVGQMVFVHNINNNYYITGTIPQNDGWSVCNSGYDEVLSAADVKVYDYHETQTESADLDNCYIGNAHFEDLNSYIKYLLLQGQLSHLLRRIALVVYAPDNDIEWIKYITEKEIQFSYKDYEAKKDNANTEQKEYQYTNKTESISIINASAQICKKIAEARNSYLNATSEEQNFAIGKLESIYSAVSDYVGVLISLLIKDKNGNDNDDVKSFMDQLYSYKYSDLSEQSKSKESKSDDSKTQSDISLLSLKSKNRDLMLASRGFISINSESLSENNEEDSNNYSNLGIDINSGAKLHVNATEELTITSDTKIVLQVGRSSITISDSKISIQSNKAFDKFGYMPFNSSLSLDGTSGATLRAPNITINGDQTVSVFDNFGSKLLGKYGDVIIDGVSVNLSSISKDNCIFLILDRVDRLVQALSHAIGNEEFESVSENCFHDLYSDLKIVFKDTRSLLYGAQDVTCGLDRWSWYMNMLTVVCDLISVVGDLTFDIWTMINEDKVNSKIDGLDCTIQELYRMILHGLFSVFTLGALGPVYYKVFKEQKKSKITLSPGEITRDAKEEWDQHKEVHSIFSKQEIENIASALGVKKAKAPQAEDNNILGGGQ